MARKKRPLQYRISRSLRSKLLFDLYGPDRLKRGRRSIPGTFQEVFSRFSGLCASPWSGCRRIDRQGTSTTKIVASMACWSSQP